jgi:hypothetical protein
MSLRLIAISRRRKRGHGTAAAGARLKFSGALLSMFLVAVALAANAHPVSAYAPQKGDRFNYSETIVVNNGQGSYTGYNDQTQVTGMEQANSVSEGSVYCSYSYSYQFSDNQGSSTSSLSAGNFTWSPSSFTYLNGSDNQVGYSKPIYVWFAMNPSVPVGGTFYALNTQFTVLSKNYSFHLPTEGSKYVQTIQAKGVGQYQRNDSYGLFTASYTWYEYFDPSTGYIVGYNDVEQDNGKYQGQAGSFTYTDNLYVTSTSYALAPAEAPSSTSNTMTANTEGTTASDLYLGYAIILGIVVVVAVIGYAVGKRRGRGGPLPKHSPYAPPPAPPSAPWESKIDLGSTPPQQVVIRDVAKVNCRYCGTLIPTTAGTCPYCGGPRQ